MAQLLLIKSTKDVIGIFDDSHIFNENEVNKFDIVQIKGKREDVEKQRQDAAGMKMAWNSKAVGWTLETPEQKLLWTDTSGSLKELVERPEYLTSFINGKFVNNIAKNPVNATVLSIEV